MGWISSRHATISQTSLSLSRPRKRMPCLYSFKAAQAFIRRFSRFTLSRPTTGALPFSLIVTSPVCSSSSRCVVWDEANCVDTNYSSFSSGPRSGVHYRSLLPRHHTTSLLHHHRVLRRHCRCHHCQNCRRQQWEWRLQFCLVEDCGSICQNGNIALSNKPSDNRAKSPLIHSNVCRARRYFSRSLNTPRWVEHSSLYTLVTNGDVSSVTCASKHRLWLNHLTIGQVVEISFTKSIHSCAKWYRWSRINGVRFCFGVIAHPNIL